MTNYDAIRPCLFRMDPERAHHLVLWALRMGLVRSHGRALRDPMLQQTIAGLDFPQPIGLAAGFDKDAAAMRPLLRLGFGYIEVGTITPMPQAGNARPRLFRLEEDEAIINRFGFNNKGMVAALRRMKKRPAGIVGVNIGANKTSSDRIADYVTGVKAFAEYADYLTLNISSPNTQNLRDLAGEAALDRLLGAVMDARGGATCPLFLKLSPDMDTDDIEHIVRTVLHHRMDGLILTNTTTGRSGLRSPHAAEPGGLSGRPLMAPATLTLRHFAQRLEGRMPLIGVGGVMSAADAYAKIRAGACLVQIYSGLIYKGPGLVGDITQGLKDLLQQDGHNHISEAIGKDL